MRRTPKIVSKAGIPLTVMALAMGGWLAAPSLTESEMDRAPHADVNAAGVVSVAPAVVVGKAIRDC